MKRHTSGVTISNPKLKQLSAFPCVSQPRLALKIAPSFRLGISRLGNPEHPVGFEGLPSPTCPHTRRSGEVVPFARHPPGVCASRLWPLTPSDAPGREPKCAAELSWPVDSTSALAHATCVGLRGVVPTHHGGGRGLDSPLKALERPYRCFQTCVVGVCSPP